MTTSATQVRNLFRRLAKVDTEPVFYGFLGDAHGVIKADDVGNVNVILFNGQVIVARNNVAPLISRLPVAVGYDKKDSKLLRVLKIWNVYENIGTPEVQPHGGSHTWPKPDFVPVRQEQILPGLAMAAGGMLVQLFGFYYFLAGQYHIVNHQTFDLTPYIPTSGAQWVNVEVDAASVISYNVGSLVANRDVLLPEDIPATASNKKLLVSIKCYEGQVDITQTEFSTDIFDPRLSGYSTGGPATSVEWDDILDKPTFPPDLGGHTHGTARWISDGTTTYELPDIAKELIGVYDNSLRVDSLYVGLSGDRSQVLFETAPTLGHVIIADYILEMN